VRCVINDDDDVDAPGVVDVDVDDAVPRRAPICNTPLLPAWFERFDCG
jgi:hypothetical protein